MAYLLETIGNFVIIKETRKTRFQQQRITLKDGTTKVKRKSRNVLPVYLVALKRQTIKKRSDKEPETKTIQYLPLNRYLSLEQARQQIGKAIL